MTVVTAVEFSAIFSAASAGPPLLVMIGVLSLTGVIVSAKLPEVLVPLPSSTENEKLSVKTSASL